jgi:hypothetical protein
LLLLDAVAAVVLVLLLREVGGVGSVGEGYDCWME